MAGGAHDQMLMKRTPRGAMECVRELARVQARARRQVLESDREGEVGIYELFNPAPRTIRKRGFERFCAKRTHWEVAQKYHGEGLRQSMSQSESVIPSGTSRSLQPS